MTYRSVWQKTVLQQDGPSPRTFQHPLQPVRIRCSLWFMGIWAKLSATIPASITQMYASYHSLSQSELLILQYESIVFLLIECHVPSTTCSKTSFFLMRFNMILACVFFLQPGSILVADALTKRNDFDLLIHNGDISYATGFLVEWDQFLELVTPVASKRSYMTSVGNHER